MGRLSFVLEMGVAILDRQLQTLCRRRRRVNLPLALRFFGGPGRDDAAGMNGVRQLFGTLTGFTTHTNTNIWHRWNAETNNFVDANTEYPADP